MCSSGKSPEEMYQALHSGKSQKFSYYRYRDANFWKYKFLMIVHETF